MEAADVLYGVTMGPDGASQVVSARMAEQEIEAEEAAGAAPVRAAETQDETSGAGPTAVAMVKLDDDAGTPVDEVD